MIQEAIEKAGLAPLSPEALDKFNIYLDLLLKWNARLNLTAIREPEAIVQRHFVESIFAAQNLPFGITALLDYGSGGGFPGVPIAIFRPEIRVTLAESQSKKASFLREVVRTLSLENAEIFAGRAEDLDQQFPVVTLRAVDKMEQACQSAVEKIASGGWFAPFTTKEAAKGLKASVDGIAWEQSWKLPGSEQRVLLLGQKK
jgi:16S rRNA (guanine527-N7)-methyltransferase